MSLTKIPILGYIAAAVLCLIAFGERTKLRADEPGDLFKANTVWRGEYSTEKTDYSLESKPVVMILYIKQRKGAEFKAVAWYPTQENGLLKVAGRVGVKGKVTFSEEEVIHGRATARRNTGVVPGMKYMGQLDKTTIKGSGKWTGPAFNGEIRMKFTLKLAE